MGFSAWETEFNSQIDSLLSGADKIQEQAAYDMLEEGIRPDTPIGKPELWAWPAKPGYEPGTLRAGWEIEVDTGVIRIFNPVPYADRAEHGWSTQAPIGMFKINVLQWPKWVERAARKVRFR